ncbi:hypothetical protein KR009_011670, partial [Drosophila setifemur]
NLFIFQVMTHGDFINQIRKTLYYGVGTADHDMEVSLPFAEYAAEIFSEPHRGHSLHRLSCVAAGKIRTTPCSLIMALIYLDRLNVIDPGYFCRITPHELFVVSLMVSTKFYAGHDERFYLEDWAKEGNMIEDRLKELELEFLSAIEWNIYISHDEFFVKLSSVERSLAEREGLRRGWLTYSELVQLLPSFAWTKFLVNGVSILALSYAASLITLAGAFFLASQVPGTLWHRRMNATIVEAVITSTIETADSVPNVAQATPVATVEMSLPSNESCRNLNVDVELMQQQQYCAETRLNEIIHTSPIAQSIPKLQLGSNHLYSEIFLSKETSQTWLHIKSQLSESRNYWAFGIYLDKRRQLSKNSSVLCKLLSDTTK